MSDSGFTNPPKKIDEDWKAQVEKEKRQMAAEAKDRESTAQETGAETPFAMFVSSLALQAAMALGEGADPLTGARKPDPRQAKYLIETLAMLEEKTKNNLTPEESEMLGALLYELRMKFVEKTRAKT